MEHLQHFGFSQDPFVNEPDLRFYFSSPRHRDALLRVDRGIRQYKGLTVLTGEAGTGKTLLARQQFEALEEEVFEVSLMVMMPGAADASSVLLRYAKQLGVEEPSDDRAALLAQIYEHLAIVREDGRHAVLIIDDAHVLSTDSLSEIGGLLNLEYEDRRLVSLMLVGLPELDIRLGTEASLLQRVDVRVRLDPLDLANTAAYVSHRLQVVGGQADVLPQSTLEALYKWSRGRPRLINTLSDNAIFEAFLGGRKQVEPTDVERAAGDLGVGADPGTTYSPLSMSSPPMPVAEPAPSMSASMGAADPLSFDPVDGVEPTQMYAAPGAPTPTPVLGELTDPCSGPAIQPQPGGMAFDAMDDEGLTALLEPSDSLSQELRELTGEDPFAVSGTIDLDVGVATALADQDQVNEQLPVFEAQSPSPTAGAEPTRIVFTDDLEAGGDSDELDGLFVELIEE